MRVCASCRVVIKDEWSSWKTTTERVVCEWCARKKVKPGG